MNAGELNIYKVSGTPCKTGAVTDYGRYRYWTGDTSTILNTKSFNDQLAQVNLLVAELTLAETDAERLTVLDDLDFRLVVLEALNQLGQLGARAAGYAINSMIEEGAFKSPILDDQERAAHLDALVLTMQNRAASMQDATEEGTTEFLEYWFGTVLPENYNDVPEAVKDRYQEFFAGKAGRVGDTVNPEDYDNVEDYIEAAAPGFLYLFLDDPKKYNATIQKRYRQEQTNFEYVRKNVGYLSDEAILAQMRSGLIKKYRMTPEKKIAQLEKLGKDYLLDKTGVVTESALATLKVILEIVSAVVALLASLWAVISQIFQVSYNAPISYETGVPETDDWGIEAESSSGSGFISRYGLWIALGAAALLLLGDNKR